VKHAGIDGMGSIASARCRADVVIPKSARLIHASLLP
jgi:hypothetical protein